MKLQIFINDPIKKLLDEYPGRNKLAVYKIYATLYLSSYRKNEFGWFEVPANCLKEVNTRYYKITQYMENVGLITRLYTEHFNPDNPFETIKKKYYSKSTHICMSYRFLMPTEGYQIFIDVKRINQHLRWYDLIYNSLQKIGIQSPKIYRDNFGLRIHHDLIKDYKDKLKGYYKLDAKASQPKIIYLEMKKTNHQDKNFNLIFEQNKDFYSELQSIFNLKDRNAAKDLFLIYLSGQQTNNHPFSNYFRGVTNYLNSISKFNYKKKSAKIQQQESKLWTQILNEIPIDFAIPIYDCIIIQKKDIETAQNFLLTNYSDYDISLEKL